MCILSTSGLGILQWHVVLVWRCDRVTFIHPKRWGIGPKSSYIEWEKKIHEKKIAILQKTLRHYGWELEETLQRKRLRNVWTPWAIENALGELWDHHWAWRTQSCYCNFEIHDNSEKWKASEQVRTHTQGSKTQRHCGFKRPMEYGLFWKVPNFTIKGSNSGLLGYTFAKHFTNFHLACWRKEVLHIWHHFCIIGFDNFE